MKRPRVIFADDGTGVFRKNIRAVFESSIPTQLFFPMMSEQELADLAADIKANGQFDPITTDATGETLIDGRNRMKAYEIAGAKQRFGKLPNGVDVRAFIVSKNLKRRTLNRAQRALAAARAWKIDLAEGRVQKSGARSDLEPARKLREGLIADPEAHYAKTFGVGEKYARMSFDMLPGENDPGDPTTIGRIDAGEEIKISDAHAKMKADRAAAAEKVRKEKDLQAAAPDLLEAVGQGELSLDEASAKLVQRRKEAEESKRREEQNKRIATGNLHGVVEYLHPRGVPSPESWAAQISGNADARYWPPGASAPLDYENLKACAEVMLAIAERWIPASGQSSQ